MSLSARGTDTCLAISHLSSENSRGQKSGPRNVRLRVSATIIPRFFFEPPKPYPYKLARRPDEPPPRTKPAARLPSPPKLPNSLTAEAVVSLVDGGLSAVVERAKSLASKARSCGRARRTALACRERMISSGSMRPVMATNSTLLSNRGNGQQQ